MAESTTGVSRVNNTRARLAAGYADRGWCLLPTRARVPVIKAWETEASADSDEVRAAWSRGGEWAGFNIGIACGPSGLVVVDLDTKGGKDGPGEFRRLLAELGVEYPKTYTVQTPSGGLHLYFEAPEGVEIRLSASQVAKGVDIRAWGGQVVAAGSTIDGREYAVVEDLPVLPLPPEFVDRLLRLPSSRSRASRADRIPEVIPEGEREEQLTSLAGTMRRRGASAAAILAALQVVNDEQCVPPVELADLERISQSVGRYDPAEPAPGVADEIEVDPDLLAKQLTTLETMRVANDMMKARAMRRQRDVLGGMAEPMSVLDFVAAGPDPVATCIWGVARPDGVMAWAQNQGVIICGPPGTGKSTIALQVVLRYVGIRGGDVLGLPVRRTERPVVYLALDRADQIRQSIRRMVLSTADPEAVARLLMIDNIPPNVDLREVSSWIAWLRVLGAGAVVIDSAKDLGFDLNDSSEGQAFNFLVQATLRAGIQILVTHHSRKTPRGDKKPLTLNDMHGSQWVAAGAGSVLMLDGEAGPKPKKLVHVKPLTVPMPPLRLELDTATGEISHCEDTEAESEHDDGGNFAARIGNLQDRILTHLSVQADPLTNAEIARSIGANTGSVTKSCASLEGKGLVERTPHGWVLEGRMGVPDE